MLKHLRNKVFINIVCLSLFMSLLIKYTYSANNELSDLEGKGRSAWYYLEDTWIFEDGELKRYESGVTCPLYEFEDQEWQKKDKDPKSVKLSKKLKEMLAEFFPDGIPQTEEEMQKYLTTITVQTLDKNGNLVTRNVTVHKAVAESLQRAIANLTASGFVIYEIGGYNWRTMATSNNMSMHSYGLAIDINVADNAMYDKNGNLVAGKTWDPDNNPYSVSRKEADMFIEEGWYWGGDWNSSKDYMHFSVTGH